MMLGFGDLVAAVSPPACTSICCSLLISQIFFEFIIDRDSFKLPQM